VSAAPAIAVVVKGYPRLSETFIAQEILALERAGLALRICSLRHPTDPAVHPLHGEIRAPLLYLPEYLHREPARVARAWRALRASAGYRRARAAWLRDLAREPTRNRARRFGQALVLAHELGGQIGHLHAHFLHTPASVARYAALLLGLGWSCSAHAKDIWTRPRWELAEKLAACRWTVTCTRANRDYLASLAPRSARVELVYHGLDLERLPPAPARRAARDGSDPHDPVRILSVGRAVDKKGYPDLLAALARLPEGLAWRFEHVGGGPLLARLRRLARRLGLAGRVRWHGPLAHDALLAHYARADLFVLASRIAADGDRDGLPNVLMEAQSQGLACVATRVSAIPELIEDRVSGWLVAERDPQALAGALAALARDPARREALGRAGERRVRSEFRLERGVERLRAWLAAELEGAAR